MLPYKLSRYVLTVLPNKSSSNVRMIYDIVMARIDETKLIWPYVGFCILLSTITKLESFIEGIRLAYDSITDSWRFLECWNTPTNRKVMQRARDFRTDPACLRNCKKWTNTVALGGGNEVAFMLWLGVELSVNPTMLASASIYPWTDVPNGSPSNGWASRQMSTIWRESKDWICCL